MRDLFEKYFFLLLCIFTGIIVAFYVSSGFDATRRDVLGNRDLSIANRKLYLGQFDRIATMCAQFKNYELR